MVLNNRLLLCVCLWVFLMLLRIYFSLVLEKYGLVISLVVLWM